MSKIKITKNGPYLVSDSLPLIKEVVEYDEEGIPLKTKKIKTISTNKDYALCRCGHSKNKPFCDGSHKTNNFNGTENPNAKQKFADQTDTLNGPDLILKDAPNLCSGDGYCHRAGGVWNLTENSDNPESKKTAIEECHCCSSGRLVAVDKSTGQDIEPQLDQSINISHNSPLCVKGGVSVESNDGSIYEIRNRVTLCRCGKSKNKPFCDASHIF